jgi:carbamoyltransferase
MNTKLINYFEKIWIFPNPGDSGASIGAALSVNNKRIDFKNMFLGHDLKENNNIEQIVSILKTDGVVGVLNGKAEFGPRALGNRSILADPRIKNIKDIVNNIKGREAFRPFAPCVLDNRAKDYFYMNNNIDYRFMQFLCNVKDNNLDGIKHIDGTSRIQTVGEDNKFLFKICLN